MHSRKFVQSMHNCPLLLNLHPEAPLITLSFSYTKRNFLYARSITFTPPLQCPLGHSFSGGYSLLDRTTREYPATFEAFSIVPATIVLGQPRVASLSSEPSSKFSGMRFRRVIMMKIRIDVYARNAHLPSDTTLPLRT